MDKLQQTNQSTRRLLEKAHAIYERNFKARSAQVNAANKTLEDQVSDANNMLEQLVEEAEKSIPQINNPQVFWTAAKDGERFMIMNTEAVEIITNLFAQFQDVISLLAEQQKK